MADDIVYRIHPSIGVARLGDAPGDDDFFVGPEVPGLAPTKSRKKDGHVLRQAARFRVFAYRKEAAGLVLVGEVKSGVDQVVEIRWNVHLANRKAAFFQFDGLHGEAGKYHSGQDRPPLPRRNLGPELNWTLDPGAKQVSGSKAGPIKLDVAGGGNWPKGADGQPVIDYLGELRTDSDGHLLVLGGRGKSGSTQSPPADLPQYANNQTWLDDVSDGPVNAEIVVTEGGVQKIVPVGADGAAWCLVAPPDFAPEITSVVTLYDLLVDMAARKLDLPNEQVYAAAAPLGWLKALNSELRAGATSLSTFLPDFERDIFPILERAVQYRWVHAPAANAHLDVLSDPALADPSPASAAARNAVFTRLRAPDQPFELKHTMPRLLGDEPYEDFAESPNRRRLALTHTQHALLTRWRDGAFTPATGTLTPGAFRAPAKLDITPWGLDRAALEACVGGAFYPGIEAGWQMRHEDLFGAPFRIKHGAPSSYLTDTSVVAAGHFSRQMAVPWQADFMDCKIEQSDATTSELRGKWGWWPAQRPDDVPGPTAQMLSWTRGSDNSHAWMVANWHKLGFVLRVGQSDQFAESGRVEP